MNRDDLIKKHIGNPSETLRKDINSLLDEFVSSRIRAAMTKEEILKNIINTGNTGYRYDNIMAVEGTLKSFLEKALVAMDEYASQFSQPASSKGMEMVKVSERLPPRIKKSDFSEKVYVKISNGDDNWLRKGIDQYDYIGKYWLQWDYPPFYVIEWLDEHGEKQEEGK